MEEHLDLAQTMARVAKKRLPPSVELDDLIQLASLGLFHAARKFDPNFKRKGYTKPVPFRSFALIYIRREIIGACRRRNWTTIALMDPLESAAEPQYTPDYDSSIDAERKRKALRNVVTMLPPEQRQAIERRYVEERPGSREDHAAAMTRLRRGLESRGIREAA